MIDKNLGFCGQLINLVKALLAISVDITDQGYNGYCCVSQLTVVADNHRTISSAIVRISSYAAMVFICSS